jgi:hypothetical protein
VKDSYPTSGHRQPPPIPVSNKFNVKFIGHSRYDPILETAYFETENGQQSSKSPILPLTSPMRYANSRDFA